MSAFYNSVGFTLSLDVSFLLEGNVLSHGTLRKDLALGLQEEGFTERDTLFIWRCFMDN